MRGVRTASTRAMVDALRGAKSVSAAAKALGVSRAIVYKRAKDTPEVAEALEALQGRKAAPKPPKIAAPSPPPTAAVEAVEGVDDPGFFEKLRLLGLDVLARKAQSAELDRDAITAARYLVQLAQLGNSAGGEPKADPKPAPKVEPLTPDQVRDAIRFRA